MGAYACGTSPWEATADITDCSQHSAQCSQACLTILHSIPPATDHSCLSLGTLGPQGRGGAGGERRGNSNNSCVMETGNALGCGRGKNRTWVAGITANSMEVLAFEVSLKGHHSCTVAEVRAPSSKQQGFCSVGGTGEERMEVL